MDYEQRILKNGSVNELDYFFQLLYTYCPGKRTSLPQQKSKDVLLYKLQFHQYHSVFLPLEK